MAIKVLIKRRIPAEHSEALNIYMLGLRSMAVKQPGYIGGETLHRVDNAEEYLVISRWRSLEDWNRWFVSPERGDIQTKIDMLIGNETKFEVYTNL